MIRRLSVADRSVIAIVMAAACSTVRAQLPAMPPPDPAFEEALPPLDAAPNAPAPPAVVAPVDRELAAPLPPIATYTVQPAAPAAVASADDQPPRVTYRVDLKGLDEVGLDGTFKPLSALLKDGRKAASAVQVGARADEDVQLIERLLRSEGYYDGAAIATVDPVTDATQALVVTLVATPGKRYRLGSIAVTQAEPKPRAYALEALGLKAGAPIQAAVIEAAEANVALILPERGYPFVKVGGRDILLDEATLLGAYTLPVDAGPKSSFGRIRTEGDAVFSPEHVAVLTRFRAGQLYDSRKVDDLRQALVATSLFSSVAVEPARTGQVNADGTEAVDLVVQQNKGPWRSLAASAGYGTGEGIKLTGTWTHRNLFPPEGALILGAVAGTQEQSVSANFRRSNAGKRDRTVQAGASVARQDFEAYNAQTVSLTGSISRASTPIWQKRWTYSIGGELIATRETRLAEDSTVDRTRSTYFIAAVPLQLGYDTSNSLLDPTSGFRLTGRLSPEAQKQNGGGYDAYARALIEGSTYFGATDSIVLAARARVGSIVGAGRATIAPSRRYYSGGGGSVRGFGFQELGPRDANNDPLGGRSLTEFAVEARYRVGDYGIVPFIDAGRVGDETAPSLSGMRYGAGIGGRYYTNFGPLRLDVATPLKRRAGESKVALYISIGQAF
jgi:translocation and assembly module TamA